jgi:hypothetical protein
VIGTISYLETKKGTADETVTTGADELVPLVPRCRRNHVRRLIRSASHGLVLASDRFCGVAPASRRIRALRSRSSRLRRAVRWRLETSCPPIVRMPQAVRSASVRRRYNPRSSAFYRGRPLLDASMISRASAGMNLSRPVRRAVWIRLPIGS